MQVPHGQSHHRTVQLIPPHPTYPSTLPYLPIYPTQLPIYPTQLPYLQGIRVHLLPEASIAIHDDRDVSRDAGRLRHQQHIIIIIIIIIIVAASTTTTTTTTTAWFLFPRHFLSLLSRMCFDHRHRYTGVRVSSDGPSCTVSAAAVAVSRGSSSSILLALLDDAIAGEPDHAVCCESNDYSQSYG